MKKFKVFVILVLAGLAGVFALQNMTVVEVQFLSWALSLPRVILVAVLVGVGFILGVIAAGISK